MRPALAAREQGLQGAGRRPSLGAKRKDSASAGVARKPSLSDPDRRFESWRQVSEIPEIFEGLGVKPRPPNTRAWRKTPFEVQRDVAKSAARKKPSLKHGAHEPGAAAPARQRAANAQGLLASTASGPRRGDERRALQDVPRQRSGNQAPTTVSTGAKVRSRTWREPMSKIKASVFDPDTAVDLKVKGQGASGESWPAHRSGEALLRQPSSKTLDGRLLLGAAQQSLPGVVESSFPPVHVRHQPNPVPHSSRRRVGHARCFGIDREKREHLDVVRSIGELRRKPVPPADPRSSRRRPHTK